MLFVDIPFPDCIAFGAQSDPMWSTTVVVVQSGHEITNQNWEDVRHAFDISFAIRTRSDYMLVREHFHQVRGRAKSFPFKDFIDFETVQANGFLLDDGVSPSGDYQMYRRYGSGSDAYDRKITRPVTWQIFRTRSAVVTNVTGASTVDDETGLVTITGHVGGDTYNWSGTFNVPCRYDTDRLPAVAVNKGQGELLIDCPSIQVVEVRE